MVDDRKPNLATIDVTAGSATAYESESMQLMYELQQDETDHDPTKHLH